MVLVDTSVWVEHLRSGSAELQALLNDGEVVCHPFVIGELACGNLRNRDEILALLQALPAVAQVVNGDVLSFIERQRLMGKGLGYIDVHLLAAAQTSGVRLWTLDRRLAEAAKKLGN